MRRIGLALAFASLLAAAQWPVAAEAQAGQPSAEALQTARQAYSQGQQHFAAGRFAEAEAAFLEAYEAVPNARVLLGIGEVRERAGNAAGAVEAFERYLNESPGASDADEIRTRVEALRARPATLVIESDPPGAAIRLNDSERVEVTPTEISVPAGEYVVALSLDGYDAAAESVTAVFGSRHEVSVSLASSGGLVPEGDVFGEEGEGADAFEVEGGLEDGADEGLPAGVWVAAGVTGAGLVTGTVLGFMALSEQSDFDATPTEDTADRGERLALFADVAFGVAAAAGITALVLYLTKDGGDDSEQAASLDVAPMWGPSVGGVSASGRF